MFRWRFRNEYIKTLPGSLHLNISDLISRKKFRTIILIVLLSTGNLHSVIVTMPSTAIRSSSFDKSVGWTTSLRCNPLFLFACVLKGMLYISATFRKGFLFLLQSKLHTFGFLLSSGTPLPFLQWLVQRRKTHKHLSRLTKKSVATLHGSCVK